MNNSIWLALMAALFYGFGGPFMKYIHQSGVSTRDFIIVASLTTLLAGLCWTNDKNLFATFSNWKILAATVVVGLLLTASFISLNQALDSPLGLASVVLVISSSNPLIGSLISLFYLGEVKQVSFPMLIAGTLLAVSGIVLVVLSTAPKLQD